MTFEELLKLPVKRSDNDANALIGCYYKHLEMEDPHNQGWYSEWKEAKRLTFNYLEDFCYDNRRTWTLCYVQLDRVTFMMFKNAGREGDDHSGKVVFDESRFREMECYLTDLLSFSFHQDIIITSLTDDSERFENFYNDSIHTPFVHRY